MIINELHIHFNIDFFLILNYFTYICIVGKNTRVDLSETLSTPFTMTSLMNTCPNVFVYGAHEELYFVKMAQESGYKRLTTFYSDLSIAEWCQLLHGETNAIKETFDSVCKSWIGDYKFFTEFVLSLNWKSWEWADDNDELGKQYAELYYRAVDLFYEHYDGNSEALEYYFNVTD